MDTTLSTVEALEATIAALALVDPDRPAERRLQRAGYVCLFDKEAELLAKLDSLARSCITRPYEEWQVSSMIDEADMIKCGYISAFPAQLTVAARIDPASYESVARSRSLSTSDLQYSGKHFAPAACLNIYPMLSQKVPKGPLVVSTLATVYRHEERGFQSLLRLWEFKVREFVFVGERDFVLEMLDRTRTSALALSRRLGIETHVENASDHFYPIRENEVRQKLQLQSQMKRELIAQVEGQSISLSSFNFHGTHFSEPYGFDQEKTIVTGCVGFGLHRWLAACLSKAGLKPLESLSDAEASSCSCNPQ